MALSIALAQTNSTYYNGTTGTSKTTGAMAYTSGNALVVFVTIRAADLASMAAETITLVRAGNTLTQIGNQAEFDASSRMKVACFLMTGGTGGTITISTAGGTRSCDRWELHAVEIGGSAHISAATVPTNVSVGTSGTGTSLAMGALAAMAAGSYTLLIGGSDAAGITYTPEAAWTGLNTGTNQTFSGYYAGQDTTPGGTKTNNIEHYAFAMEIQVAGGAADRPRLVGGRLVNEGLLLGGLAA